MSYDDNKYYRCVYVVIGVLPSNSRHYTTASYQCKGMPKYSNYYTFEAECKKRGYIPYHHIGTFEDDLQGMSDECKA